MEKVKEILTNKKVLIAASVFILFFAAAFGVYAIMVSPSRQPFRDAATQYQSTYRAVVNVMDKGASINATSASSEQFTKNIEIINNSLDSLKIELDALGGYEVLKDGKGKELYQLFADNIDKYISYNRNLLLSMEKVRPVIFECSNKMTDVSENEAGVKAMQACADNLAGIKDVPDGDYRQLVADSQASYAKFAANLEKRAALQDPSGADSNQYEVYGDQQTEILKEMNDSGTAFATNLRKSRQAVNITDAAIELESYLDGKSRIFQR